MEYIKISRDFSESLIGRFYADSGCSAEKFREEYLKPSLEVEKVVIVDIDGVTNYSAAFLEEAFGGLVTKGYFSKSQIKNKLRIICEDPDYKMYKYLIWKYIDEAISELTDKE